MTLEELHTLLQALPEPTLVVTADGVVRAFNRAALHALEPGASASLPGPLPLSAEGQERLASYLRLCARSGEALPGALCLERGGQAPPLRLRCQGSRLPIRVEGLEAPVLLRLLPGSPRHDPFLLLNEQVRQLTEEVKRRRSAESAARASEERLRLLAEMVPQLVWVATPDGALEYCNQRWTEYTGSTPVAGRAEHIWSLFHPEDAPRVRRAWRHSVATGAAFELEFRLRGGAQGAYRWFLGRAVPARDEGGAVVKWFGSCTDIQARKEAEERAVDEVSARDEFLSVASHELKTPLTALKLQLDLLARLLERSGAMEGPVQGRLEAARRQIARLDALNDSLLDVSRMHSGRLVLEPCWLDLSRLVHESVERLEAELQGAGCTLTLDLQPEVVAWVDPLRLEQVVVNLLGNALKYGPGKPIEVSLRAAEGRATLAIRDHGIGIPAEALGRIFEKFERAASARQYGGLGLGLFISRQIVAAMGGTIEVESVPAEATTFRVSLPLGPEPRRARDRMAGTTLHPAAPPSAPAAGS